MSHQLLSTSREGGSTQLCVTSDLQIVYARIGQGPVVGIAGAGRRCTNPTTNPTGSGPVTAGANLNWFIDCGLTVPQGSMVPVEIQFRVVYAGPTTPPVPVCTP